MKIKEFSPKSIPAAFKQNKQKFKKLLELVP